MKVNIIGAGLAGSEAAYQLAKRGIDVNLFEMRPKVKTDVHETEYFGELVCSNSFRSDDILNAVGLLKAEMRLLDSLILKAADKCSLPAGSALAVDRLAFAKEITKTLESYENINIIREEVVEIPKGYTIIATGPMTSDNFSKAISDYFSEDYLHFFDAVAPIIDIDSIDLNKAYFKSRYDKGTADYLNCAMTKAEFELFYKELSMAKRVPSKEYEDETFFNACMPVEEIANQGKQTLLFGPMKPVGLEKDEDHKPHAVVQLRQDNFAKSLYNIVGFQTRLTWPEQKRIIRLIPGLEKADIVRYGVMHKNSYINSPKILNHNLQVKKRLDLMVAGQFSGVEGYIESAAMGLLAGLNMAKLVKGEELLNLDNSTMIGSLANYICNANPDNFQPMNVNHGLIKFSFKAPKRVRRQKTADLSLSIIKELSQNV
ncbi:MAG TPA: methylenetetrahydrofolate--tRNA-(uracil(54)-C(5))-methyltransferase (FADH(2)-oxidizing) TrmFO [Erysipelotrichaceae bacterium]|nr:methylenetetrahydrofolate--tRNA-(uracil(54)-C(5))-methyltransferase (FADH(2)-oxidizing) TrmFO [Erysipelotrichaceae bacterium]